MGSKSDPNKMDHQNKINKNKNMGQYLDRKTFNAKQYLTENNIQHNLTRNDI